MTKIVNMHEAKTQLSRLVEAALQGEQVTIAKAGKPLVRLVPISPSDELRPAGVLKSKLHFGSDINAPLPDPLKIAGQAK